MATEVVVYTLYTSNGVVATAGSSLVAATQAAAIALAQDGGATNSNAGLSDATKKTIGGVVGGVGGAILLGAIAVVAWRVWGRKSHHEEDYGLMEEKEGTPNQWTSTLDQYHKPGGASANF